ncbi:hypothetical protein P3T73_02195 [Kiritimatiellota bacterium B12222]|nr:hypothetical protein P3T73_02195 [Kiritimatiellota bacterium B12222]
MPAKKTIRVKRKATGALTPKKIIRIDTNAPEPMHTVKIDDTDVLDNASSGVVKLNSSTLKDPVEQRPLDPETAEDSPDLDLTQDLTEATFKFFCYRCGQKLKVPISWANMSTSCGRCGHDLVVPPPLAGVIG